MIVVVSGLQSDAVTRCYWQPAHCVVVAVAVVQWLITCCQFKLPMVCSEGYIPDDDDVMLYTGSWFEQQVSRKQCTFCNSYFELVT